MKTITYNHQTNELKIISDNNRPIAGIIGPAGKRRLKTIIKNEIARLEHNSDALQKWLYSSMNTDNKNWTSIKSEYDALQIRIMNLRKKLNHTTKDHDHGMITVSLPSNDLYL